MKKLVKIFMGNILLLGGISYTNAMQIDIGWNLVTLGDNCSSNCTYILKQLPQKSLIFIYKNHQWYARSNDTSLNNIISSNTYINIADVINASNGIWIYNSSQNSINISMCNTSSSSSSVSSGITPPDIPESSNSSTDSDLPQFTYN